MYWEKIYVANTFHINDYPQVLFCSVPPTWQYTYRHATTVLLRTATRSSFMATIISLLAL